MGCDNNFTCQTCKQTYYLGYSSYGSWLTSSKSIEEYRSFESEHKDLFENMNFETCLELHDGHDFIVWSGDFFSTNANGDLEDDLTGRTFIEGIAVFEYFDFELAEGHQSD